MLQLAVDGFSSLTARVDRKSLVLADCNEFGVQLRIEAERANYFLFYDLLQRRSVHYAVENFLPCKFPK